MSTATAYQPTPAHQLHSSNTTSQVETFTQNEELKLQGSVEAELSFYDPPKDGSKVCLILPLELPEAND